MSLHDARSATHEHLWQVVSVDYDEACPCQELHCDCGAVSFSAG